MSTYRLSTLSSRCVRQVQTQKARAIMMDAVAAKLSMDAKYKLASGYEMPILGYGVYQTPATICESVTLNALQTGYRHIDSATAYRNEAPCSAAMRASGIPREQIFFTTKIRPQDMGYEKTKRAIAKSLTETSLSYIDLILVHAPYGGKEARCGTWKALVEAQQAQKIRSLGISNYGLHHLTELTSYISTLPTPTPPISVVQYELHPWLPRAPIVSFCRSHSPPITIQAWSPLVRGTHSASPILAAIGAKHGKSWAQVLLRWSLQQGFVPLPKSVTAERIQKNAEVWDFELDAEDMASLEFPGTYEPCSWDPTVSDD